MTAIQGKLRKSSVSALITTLSLLVVMDQAAPAFHITSVYRDQGRTHVVYESDPTGYFLALSGTSVTEVATAIDIELGQMGSGMLMEPDAASGGFYAVLRVPRDAPQDTDGDGMDDVFELERTFLRPLDPDDAYRDQDKDGISNLGEYRLGSDPDDPMSGPVAAATADTDDDGYPDAYETVHGSDLGNAASRPIPTLLLYPGDSIQSALDSAKPFDIIALADGVYAGVGNRRFPGPLTPVLLTSRNGPDRCIIDMELNPDHRGFVFEAGQTGLSVLRGITVRRGARGPGAGIEIAHRSSPTLWGCIIEDCATADRGAGIRVTGESQPRIVRCIVRNNTAGEYGGGIYVTGGASPVIHDCWISGNQAGDDGGGIGCRNDAAPRIVGCRIENNHTDGDGGAIGSNFSASPLIETCLLRENDATGRGGAVFSGNSAVAHLRNCTLISNDAGALGGALYHFSTSPITVENSILYGNLPNQVTGNGAADVNYSCVEGASVHPGMGNINQDPRLTPHTFRLRSDSPCIDAGSELASPRHDWDGEIRFDHPAFPNPAGFVDMGVDEFVDADRDDMGDAWESTVGLPLDDPDGMEDPDADTLVNLDEHDQGLNPLDPAPGTGLVLGHVSDFSSRTGTVVVVAAVNADDWTGPSIELPDGGAYTLPSIPTGEDRWIKAFRDSNGDGQWDPCEPWGAYPVNPVQVGPLTPGVDITLAPDDVDAPALIGVPADRVVGCDQIPLAPVVTAVDDKDGPVSVTFEEVIPVYSCPYTVIRVWSATDRCGNRVSATQYVTVTTAVPASLPMATGFETAEGFAPGDLAGQGDWIGSTSGTTIQTQTVMSGSQALSLDTPEALAFRPVVSLASGVATEFSLYIADAAHGPEAPTAFPGVASVVLSHDPARGLVALDGDGAGGGVWRVVPGTENEGTWVSVRIVKQDATTTWSIAINGAPPLTGLGYKDAAATGMRGIRFHNGQSGHLVIDEVNIQ